VPPVIDQAVRVNLITSVTPVQEVSAILRYRCDDPLAVRVCFPPQASLAGSHVEWVFGRDLLAAGLEEPVGEGDVRIRPLGSDATVLEFHAAVGTAMVRTPTVPLRSFMRQSYRLVPAHSEHLFLDLDRDLAALLREA
jgi:hypothetical protein